MKKLLAILLSVFMIMTMIACAGGDTSEGTDTESASETESISETESTSESETDAETVTESDSATETETETSADTDTDTETDTETETETIDEDKQAMDDFFASFAEGFEIPTEFKADAELVLDMKVMGEGVPSTLTGSLTVKDSSVAFQLVPDGGDAVEMVYVDNALYLTAAGTDKLVCTITMEELTAFITEMFGGMMGGTEGVAEGFDPSIMPGLEDIMAGAAAMKPSDMVAEVTITVDPDTGVTTLTLGGLSETFVSFLNEVLEVVMAGYNTMMPLDDMSGENDISALIALIPSLLESLQNPENFNITVAFDSELRMIALDIHASADLSLMVITVDMGLDMDYGAQTVTAPEDADTYVEITFEDLLAGLLGEEEVDELFDWGTITEVTVDDEGNNVVTISVEDYDENGELIFTPYTFYVAEEILEDVKALVDMEVYFVYDDTNTVVYVEEIFGDISTISIVGYIASFDANSGVLVIDEIIAEDDGSEYTEAVEILVPADLTEAVLAINPETCMAFATCELDDDFNFVLTAIEPWACSAE